MADKKASGSTPKQYPVIRFKKATERGDGGNTDNYVVYSGGGVVNVQNKKGEKVQKNAILGGNGSIYVANELAGEFQSWVLIPAECYDAAIARKAGK